MKKHLQKTNKPGHPKRLASERFHNLYKKMPSGCWFWLGYLRPAGYGMITDDGGTAQYAHRFSWILHFGLIPINLFVCHKCDNPRCVNPEHLFLGSAQDNLDDMVKKGRSVKGIMQWEAKLDENKVIEIRELATKGSSHTELSLRFGISRRQINNVVKRRAWRHIK